MTISSVGEAGCHLPFFLSLFLSMKCTFMCWISYLGVQVQCLSYSFGSHFPVPSLKCSKLKHLDEPRKSCSDVLTVSIPTSLCSENRCIYNTTLSHWFPSAKLPVVSPTLLFSYLVTIGLTGFKPILLSVFFCLYFSPPRQLTVMSKDPRKKGLFGL